MIDTLPWWISAPVIAGASIAALYRCYILPGYRADVSRETLPGEDSAQ